MVYLCVSNGFGGQRGFRAVESWNWPADSTVTVHCFANCPEVTLTLNGKTIGTQKLADAERGSLRWEIPYEPGTLEAIGRADGREVCRYTLQTAGPPARIELLPDASQLQANGKNVCHLEFRIVDAHGLRVPDAGLEVTFDLTGPAKILGIGNGDLDSVENCKTNAHAAFQGRGLAILQSITAPGEITVKVSSPGLEGTNVTLRSQ
jgi:beta-galactosidase